MSPTSQAQQTINSALGRLSFDSERANTPPPHSKPNGVRPQPNGLVNGDDHLDGGGEGQNGQDEAEEMDPIEKLQQELERTRQEREEFASQYRNLLARLNTMRSTLGNKLKQDAVRIIFILLFPPMLQSIILLYYFGLFYSLYRTLNP